MRKLALTITSTTCVFSAFGVFSRWLQNMTAFEENGLYKSGSFWGVALMLLCIAAAAVLYGFTLYFRKNLNLASPPDMAAALKGATVLHKPVLILVALIMTAGGVLLLFTAGDAETPLGADFSTLLRVLALLGILSVGGFVGMTMGRGGETVSYTHLVSRLYRLPLQTSQGTYTSGRKCISILMRPSPEQASQRPPFVLKEKRPGP